MRREHRSAWLSLVASLLLVLPVTFLAGCGSEGSGGAPALIEPTPTPGPIDPGPQPGQGSVVLEAPVPTTITAGASGAVVQATVRDAGGAAVAGQTVTFTVTPSTVVQLSSPTAITNTSGIAQVTLTGLRAGTVSVTARAGSVTGNTVALTVLAPSIAVAVTPADGQITASTSAGAGATIAFTVTDQGGAPIVGKTVTFATTLGVLDATSRNTNASGVAQVKLTSQEAGEALVSGQVLGATSDTAAITVSTAALKTPLTVTTSSNKIPTNSSATITIQAADLFGNPVDDDVHVDAILLGTTAATGDLSPATVQLIDGSGTTVFTPSEQGVVRIRVGQDAPVSAGGTQIGAVDISVELVLVGEPAQITFAISHSEIAVEGGGGTESSSIDITVLDVNGDPIQDGLAPNNLQVEILQGPNGGESLDGIARLGQVRTLSTSSGRATVELQSGIRPGTVLIQARVTKDSQGNDLTGTQILTATVPQITIRSGAPASLFLTRSNSISSPGLRGNGSITHDYLAFVSDLWGNAVPDDTVVFFSQFLNIKAECRNRSVFDPSNPGAVNGYVEETCTGSAAGSITQGADGFGRARFTSGSVPFAGVTEGDTLVIITEDNPNGYGGYRIYAVEDGGMSVLLDNDFAADDSGLEWAVGNNANLGGGVFTTEGQAATIGGVARWSNTYAGELVNGPAYIYAEAEGGTQGHGRFFRLAWAAPTAHLQGAGPESGDTVSAGSLVVFSFTYTDGSSPTPYVIPSVLTGVSASGGSLGVLPGTKAFLDLATGSILVEGTPRDISTGDPGGTIGFMWSPPAGAVAGDKFSVSVSGGGLSTKIDLTIQ